MLVTEITQINAYSVECVFHPHNYKVVISRGLNFFSSVLSELENGDTAGGLYRMEETEQKPWLQRKRFQRICGVGDSNKALRS